MASVSLQTLSLKLVLISLCLLNTYGQVYLGDKCVLYGTTNGTCALLRNCKSAKNNLRTGIRPIICSYNGVMPIVCCEELEAVTVDPPPLASRASSPEEVVGQIAREKCVQYGNALRKYLNYPKDDDLCDHASVGEIRGRNPARPKEFPHMALLGFEMQDEKQTVSWECGGTLISEQWVMTAGHCANSAELGPVKYVRLGSPRVNDTVDPSTTYSIKTVVRHPDYTRTSNYNDIALLELNQQVTFSDSILPACLHDGTYIDDIRYIASGWGKLSFGGVQSNDLLRVVLEEFAYDVCAVAHSPSRKSLDGINNSTQLCAGSWKEAKGTCQGDSGGPLQTSSSVPCMRDVVGIISHGLNCAVPAMPTVFTRVAAFVPWIESVVWPNYSKPPAA